MDKPDEFGICVAIVNQMISSMNQSHKFWKLEERIHKDKKNSWYSG